MDGYHSEVQLGLAGLLGVMLKVNKSKRWKCPFGYCVAEFDRYSEIADHVLNTRAHKEYERYLDTEVGGFWAPILGYLNAPNEWPTAHQIFQKDGIDSRIEVIPMRLETAIRTWRTGDSRHTAENLGDFRVMPGSPMEDVLHYLRRRASAPTSADTSDVERLQRHRDNSDEEVGTKKNQKQTQKLKRPGERSDNQYSDLKFDRGYHKDRNKFKNGTSN
jgi:hypothetical protein